MLKISIYNNNYSTDNYGVRRKILSMPFPWCVYTPWGEIFCEETFADAIIRVGLIRVKAEKINNAPNTISNRTIEHFVYGGIGNALRALEQSNQK